jgi:hypothetical protein
MYTYIELYDAQNVLDQAPLTVLGQASLTI